MNSGPCHFQNLVTSLLILRVGFPIFTWGMFLVNASIPYIAVHFTVPYWWIHFSSVLMSLSTKGPHSLPQRFKYLRYISKRFVYAVCWVVLEQYILTKNCSKAKFDTLDDFKGRNRWFATSSTVLSNITMSHKQSILSVVNHDRGSAPSLCKPLTWSFLNFSIH